MGTRNLTCVYLNGKYRVAQYCQWDGYPSGQGQNILKFLRAHKTKHGIALFAKQVNQLCRFISAKEIEKRWKQFGAKNGSIGMDDSARFKAAFPELHRDTGFNILDIIWNATGYVELQNDIKFAADGLFCEWAYVIDLDKRTFEVYRGFGKGPEAKLPEHERFAFLNDASLKVWHEKSNPKGPEEHYWPVRLFASYSLDDLPTIKGFLKEMEDLQEAAEKQEEAAA